MPHRVSDTMLMPVRSTGFPLYNIGFRHGTCSTLILYSMPTALLCGVTLPHQRVGDTLMGRSLGEASIVVNAGLSLGEA